MKPMLAVLTVLVLLLAACGSGDEAVDASDSGSDSETETETDPSTDTSSPDPVAEEEVVFVWNETGGCAMAGPNCARYEVTSLGAVSTYREGEELAEVTGSIDETLVKDWMALVSQTDIDELVAKLGPGEMTAAFDGVDFVLEAPNADLRLSSVDVEFDTNEPLFRDAEQLASLAANAAPLDLKQR